MEKTKLCTRCGRELPVSNFSRRTKSKDGLQPYCKDCQREEAAAYYKRKSITKTFTAAKADEDEQAAQPLIPADKPMARVRVDIHSLSAHEIACELKKRPDFSLKEEFTARQLINALYDLGYRGELKIMVEHTVRLSHE